MSIQNGICLISVPKSGTMFLSRYLEKIAGSPVIFGLQGLSAPALRQQLSDGWRDEIKSNLSASSPSLEVMTRRFSLMLERNRVRGQQSGKPLIYSDHGLSSFLRFLINPRNEEIQSPQEIINWANENKLATVFLYRDIRAIANSLAHFLASNKSFLIGIDSLEHAAELVARYYAPVLAEQMRVWQAHAPADVLCVSYEELMQDPAHWIQLICRKGGLPCDSTGIAGAPDSYRSWTYRSNGAGWTGTFSEAQQAVLNGIAVGA